MNKIKEDIIFNKKEISIPPYLSERKPIFFKHIKTYLYLSDKVKDKNVLDVGYGYGYGTYILSHKAKSVVGIDLGEKRIEGAKNFYGNIQNIEFRLLDAFKLNSAFTNGSFDIIIALEFIEHIKNPLNFLQIARKLLSDDGLLVLSTPNRLTRGVEGTPWDPEHVREYDPDSLRDLLCKEFNTNRIIRYDRL
jgi:2-polyprenyl-3-methyl-5-hydroxy-6-metoxy-1,4-benzoquinol methylase